MIHFLHLFITIYHLTLSYATTTTNHQPTIYNSYYFNLNNASQWFTNQPNNSSQQTICTLQIPSLCIQYTSQPQQQLNILYKDTSFNFIQPIHNNPTTLQPSNSNALSIPSSDDTISTRRRLRSRCPNMLYHHRTRFKPRKGHRIRNINFEDNMIFSLEIRVLGWPRHTWENIFHCGQRNTIRQPAIWINKHGKYFHIVYGIKRNWNQLKNMPRIRLGRKYKIEWRIRRNYYDVYINGRRWYHVRGRHHNHRNQPCYLSDPWYRSANVHVENVKIIRGTDPRGGCRRGRWTGPYRILAGHGKCLDVRNANRNGGPLQVWQCHNAPNQKWYYHTGTRQMRIGSHHGKCADLHGHHFNQRRNGGSLFVYRCHGGRNQKFFRSGRHIKALNGKCFDVHGTHYRRRINGGKVWAWQCHNGRNQQWRWQRWRPIGRNRRRHQKLHCPSGTRTIGRQGQRNDIGGCGLEGCNSRYSVKTIYQCKRRCARNRRCKSFSWAPRGGDRNHRNRHVCTLYDRSRGNNRWGPNQIMCTAARRKRRDWRRPLSASERRDHKRYYKKMYKLGKDIGKIFKKDKDIRCGKKCKKQKPVLHIPSFDPFNMGPVHPEWGLGGFIVDKSLEEQEKEKEEEQKKEGKEGKRRLMEHMDVRLKKCMLVEDGMNEICLVYYYFDGSMGMEYNVMVNGYVNERGYDEYFEEYVLRMNGIGCDDRLVDVMGYIVCVEKDVDDGLDVILKEIVVGEMMKIDLGNDSEWDKIYKINDIANSKCMYGGKLEICIEMISDDIMDVVVKKLVGYSAVDTIYENVIDSE